MNSNMPYRKLRIAFTAACGVVCVLLVVLWVRSYWFEDSIARGHVQVASNSGAISIVVTPTFSYSGWWRRSVPLNNILGDPLHFLHWQGKDSNGQDYTMTNLPHWLPVVVLLALGFISQPWIHPFRWQFSLRTLLITTTLLALALGTVIYTTR